VGCVKPVVRNIFGVLEVVVLVRDDGVPGVTVPLLVRVRTQIPV